MSDDPLFGRPSLVTSRMHPLIKEVHELAVRNNLRGCVLISFTDERVAVNSSGSPERFGEAMEELANRILAMIDDGLLDPAGGKLT